MAIMTSIAYVVSLVWYTPVVVFDVYWAVVRRLFCKGSLMEYLERITDRFCYALTFYKGDRPDYYSDSEFLYLAKPGLVWIAIVISIILTYS